MDVKVDHVEQLLEMLAEKTRQPLDLRGFGVMSELIGNIPPKYLYENLYRKKENAKRENLPSVSLQAGKLDQLAQFLGFKSFRIFLERLTIAPNKVLLSCVGNYCSFVRRNSEVGVLFCSPVRISERDGKIWFELKGPKWNYVGELELKNGCLFVLMKAPEGKEIHHVYKIGTRERPDVLQGIYSGVSTVFDPIGGRTVLIRKEEAFSSLRNAELEVSALKKSKDLMHRRLAEYFSTYEANNLLNRKTVTFTLDDLGTCR